MGCGLRTPTVWQERRTRLARPGAAIDLGVSVATGTRWLGRFDCAQGPVLLLFGEGGDRNLLRRLDAVSLGRNIDPAELDGLIRSALTVPRLDSKEQIERVADELDALRPRVVLLDPLYLAAAGGKGRDLYAMGQSLQAIQGICQDAGSALVVMTHWNQTGDGTGASRFTGVGPSAWGRVLASAAVEQSKTEDGRSLVTLFWEFTGGEIPDTRFRMQRQVWVDDPSDLTSPMHYEVESPTRASRRSPTTSPRARTASSPCCARAGRGPSMRSATNLPRTVAASRLRSGRSKRRSRPCSS